MQAESICIFLAREAAHYRVELDKSVPETNGGAKHRWTVEVLERLSKTVKPFVATPDQQALIFESIVYFCIETADAASRRRENVSLLPLAAQINSFAS